jgi:hypothetical protein
MGLSSMVVIGMVQLLIARENAHLDGMKGVVVSVGMEAAVGLGARPCAVKAQMKLVHNCNHYIMFNRYVTQSQVFILR